MYRRTALGGEISLRAIYILIPMGHRPEQDDTVFAGPRIIDWKTMIREECDELPLPAERHTPRQVDRSGPQRHAP